MPGFKINAGASHSVNHREFAPPLALARTQSGWYCEDRGKFAEVSSVSGVMRF